MGVDRLWSSKICRIFKEIKIVVRIIKDISKSRAVRIFLLLHFLLLIIIFVKADVSGQAYFDVNNGFLERLFYQMIFVFYLPSIVVANLISGAIQYKAEVQALDVPVSSAELARIFLIFAFFSTVQVILIGYGIGKVITRMRKIK